MALQCLRNQRWKQLRALALPRMVAGMNGPPDAYLYNGQAIREDAFTLVHIHLLLKMQSSAVRNVWNYVNRALRLGAD